MGVDRPEPCFGAAKGRLHSNRRQMANLEMGTVGFVAVQGPSRTTGDENEHDDSENGFQTVRLRRGELVIHVVHATQRSQAKHCSCPGQRVRPHGKNDASVQPLQAFHGTRRLSEIAYLVSPAPTFFCTPMYLVRVGGAQIDFG